MADSEIDLDDLTRRMNGAVEALKKDFSGLRTGRASASLLDGVVVNVYGSDMPLNQIGTVNVPESRLISVQIWDRNNVGAAEKAIRNSGLGLNPATEGSTIRVPIPELTEERRTELSRIAHKYAEQAKIAVRHVRRDGMDTLKKMEKDGEVFTSPLEVALSYGVLLVCTSGGRWDLLLFLDRLLSLDAKDHASVPGAIFFRDFFFDDRPRRSITHRCKATLCDASFDQIIAHSVRALLRELLVALGSPEL